MMRNLNLPALIIILMLAACSGHQKTVSDEDKFIEELLSQMTLAEKVGQLNQYTSLWEMTGPAPAGNAGAEALLEQLKSGMVGSMLNVNGAEATRKAQQTVVENTRLGIPLIFGYDVIHGYKTMFPIPLAEAASWNPELARLSSEVAAKEAAVSGIHWTFAPMVDVGRDARWGRVMEGAGEDPFLGSAFARARVQGFQGDDLSNPFTIAACAKHFAGYAFSDAGRDYNSVEIGNETLYNIVLPPFQAAAEAGVATFMNGFNTINGLPVTADSHLQRDLLKGEWGFDGFVVSDWNSIGEIEEHGAAANLKECAERAVKGGSDMDMEARAYITYLEELVSEGKIEEALVNDAVRRVLRIKYRLGLFDDPYKYCNEANEKDMMYTAEHRAAARKVARESMVLLKNENHILPLSTNAKSIAVIGPLANDKDSPLGNWRAKAESNTAVSLLEGVQAAVGASSTIHYAEGCQLSVGPRNFTDRMIFNTTDRSGFGEAIAAARRSDVVLLAIGEDCYQSGEGRSMTDIGLKGLQQELFDEIYKVNKNIVVVLMNGRPIAIPEIAEKAAAILETWHSGSEGGHAIADVLFGKYNPSGKLPVSFPRHVGQCPVFYNYKNTGRPVGQTPEWVLYSCYNDAPNSPQFPFGYGLSYTTFAYSDLTLDQQTITKEGQLTVKVSVSNTGDVDGEEVVQLYIQDIAATYARPVKELKGFEKVQLKAGEAKELTFTLTEKELGYYFPTGEYVVEFGEFNVFVGTNSVEVKQAQFSIQ
jgi:beta-glucosidase